MTASWISTSPTIGRIVASITVFGELTIRDAADFTILAGPIAAHIAAQAVAARRSSITNDGRLVVTDGDDGAKLWDIDTLEQIGSVFPDEAPVQAAELAKDANLLATVVGDEVVLWNVDTSSWFEVGCRAVARSMTQAEWDQFGPADQPYVATCDRCSRRSDSWSRQPAARLLAVGQHWITAHSEHPMFAARVGSVPVDLVRRLGRLHRSQPCSRR